MLAWVSGRFADAFNGKENHVNGYELIFLFLFVILFLPSSSGTDNIVQYLHHLRWSRSPRHSGGVHFLQGVTDIFFV